MREGEWLAESDSAPRTGKAAQLLRQLSHPALAVGNVPVDGNPLPAGPFLMGGHLGQQLCRRRSQPDGAGTLPGAGKLRLQLNVLIFPGTLPDAPDGLLQLPGRMSGSVRQVMARNSSRLTLWSAINCRYCRMDSSHGGVAGLPQSVDRIEFSAPSFRMALRLRSALLIH